MKRWALWVALAAVLIGGVFASLSTAGHIRINRQGLEESSYCAISDVINCDVVNASSYSVFLGVPIAWWGLCYYVSIGMLALFALLSRRERKAGVAVAWFMACGGVLYSAFLAYIAFFVLRVLCIECVAMYIANILLVIFLYAAMGIPFSRVFWFIRDYALAFFGRRSNLGFSPSIPAHAAAIGLVFLLGFLAISHIRAEDRRARPEMGVREMVDAFYMQSLHDIRIDPSWAVWGNPDAEVAIVEFSDYQCPFCRIAAFNVKPYLQEFRRDVRYHFVNYPLDSACNDALDRPMYPSSCFAAKAGICADMRGEFWRFHDGLFRAKGRLTEEAVLKVTDGLGWERAELLDCINSPEVAERLDSEIMAARRVYVTGTPTLYLNGRPLRYWRDPRYLQAQVREEIRRSSRRALSD